MRGILFVAAFALDVVCASVVAQDVPVKSTPAAPALARSRQLIEELFASELNAAQTPASHRHLAQIFAKQAKENAEEPANRFVLLEFAQQQAALAGDATEAFGYLRELTREFDVDPLPLKCQIVARVGQAAETPAAARSVVELAQPLIQETIDADRVPLAVQLGDISYAAAIKSADLALVDRAEKQRQHIAAIAEGFTRLGNAIDRLRDDPDDPAANLALGKYYGFLKGSWDKAIPLLARGDDEPLKALAKRDFAAPATAAEQLKLADAWWTRALDQPEPARSSLQARAAYWYGKSLPGLAGLNRAKASHRIEAVRAERRPTETKSTEPIRASQ